MRQQNVYLKQLHKLYQLKPDSFKSSADFNTYYSLASSALKFELIEWIVSTSVKVSSDFVSKEIRPSLLIHFTLLSSPSSS